MPFTKLVVAGSSGILADAILPVLLKSTSPKFQVTVLTRAGSGKTTTIPGAKVVAVNYDDHNALTAAVSGADAIISLLASVAGKVVDLQLLKAAQEAGVRRIFPSEFTLDILHPYQVSLLTEGGDWPESPSAVLTAQTFAALAEHGGPTSFTTVMPSGFMDPWLEGKIDLFKPQERKITLIDGGNHYFTGCTLPFVAAALVAILQMDEEKTKNKRIPIAEVRGTLNEIAAAYEELLGAEMQRVEVTTEQMLQERNEFLKAGNMPLAMFTCVKLGAFSGAGPGDLQAGLDFDGDGFLSVKRKSLQEIVADAVKAL